MKTHRLVGLVNENILSLDSGGGTQSVPWWGAVKTHSTNCS